MDVKQILMVSRARSVRLDPAEPQVGIWEAPGAPSPAATCFRVKEEVDPSRKPTPCSL
jgi:hypothetical protein